ncbi:MAG: hypothetical protein QM667_07015 [Asticcacaulis sp.]
MGIRIPKEKWVFAGAAGLCLIIIIAIAALSYLQSRHAGQKGTHFRITAIIEVDGDLYSASTIQAYTCPGPFRSIRARVPGRCRILGEALDIPTPEKRVLLLLRSAPHPSISPAGNADELARNISRALSADGQLKAYLGPQAALLTSQGVRLAKEGEVRVLSIQVAHTIAPVEYGHLPQSLTQNLPAEIKPYDLKMRY